MAVSVQRYSGKIIYSIACFILIFASACTSPDENKVANNDYLLKVGDQTLDAEIFIRRYRLSKDFADAPKIAPNHVKNFAEQFFIENLLFRAEGFRLNLVEDSNLQTQIETQKKKLLTQANGPLYKDITRDVKVTEAEIQQLYDSLTEEVKFAHILVGSDQLADSLYNLLQNGSNFKRLVEIYSLDINTIETNGVIPQYLVKGDLHPEMEKTLFSMKPGEYSRPVKTGIGYHVARLIDRRPHQRGAFQQIRSDLVKQLKQRKVEQHFESYLQSLKEKYRYEVIDSVAVLLAGKYRYFSGLKKLPLSRLSAQEAAYIVAKFEGKNLSAHDFITQLNRMPKHVRSNVKTPEGIAQLIANIAQPDLLYKDAVERGLDKDADFQKKLVYITGNLVQKECQRQLVYSQVSMSDAELKSYYQKSKERYGDRPFEEVRSMVQGRLRNEKQQALMAEVAATLKNRYQVSYNDAVLTEVLAKLNQIKQS